VKDVIESFTMWRERLLLRMILPLYEAKDLVITMKGLGVAKRLCHVENVPSLITRIYQQVIKFIYVKSIIAFSSAKGVGYGEKTIVQVLSSDYSTTTGRSYELLKVARREMFEMRGEIHA